MSALALEGHGDARRACASTCASKSSWRQRVARGTARRRVPRGEQAPLAPRREERQLADGARRARDDALEQRRGGAPSIRSTVAASKRSVAYSSDAGEPVAAPSVSASVRSNLAVVASRAARRGEREPGQARRRRRARSAG